MVGEPKSRTVYSVLEQVAAVEFEAREKANARIKELEGRRIPYFDARGADRLAREVEALVKRGVIDARSPAGDALLDYQEGRGLAGKVKRG